MSRILIFKKYETFADFGEPQNTLSALQNAQLLHRANREFESKLRHTKTNNVLENRAFAKLAVHNFRLKKGVK